jgi:hypothetical protein
MHHKMKVKELIQDSTPWQEGFPTLKKSMIRTYERIHIRKDFTIRRTCTAQGSKSSTKWKDKQMKTNGDFSVWGIQRILICLLIFHLAVLSPTFWSATAIRRDEKCGKNRHRKSTEQTARCSSRFFSHKTTCSGTKGLTVPHLQVRGCCIFKFLDGREY